MSIRKSTPEHDVAYQELAALVGRHADKMTAAEVLAIAANLVGKLVAMQDQRTITPVMAMEIVARNIEAGNRQVLAELTDKTAGHA